MEQYDAALRWQPTAAPPHMVGRADDNSWRQFDSSVNAVSFGFVATAVLVSMFLVMAVLEKLFRSSTALPSAAGRSGQVADLESQVAFDAKLSHSPPRMSVYSRRVFVLMPGEDTPTFIAHPTPLSCPS